VPEGRAKYPVLLLDWSLTAVGVTATVLNELSPAKNVVPLRVPVAFSLLMLTVSSVRPEPLKSATLNVPNATMYNSSSKAAPDPSTMLSPLDAV
jgi:hypothetical protein